MCNLIKKEISLPASFLTISAFGLIGATLTTAQRDYGLDNLDLLRVLAEKPWLHLGQGRWDRTPRIDEELGNAYPRINRQLRQEEVGPGGYDEEVLSSTGTLIDISSQLHDGTPDPSLVPSRGSEKRSAVATALNAGRRRRQPTPALGKAVTPYVGVGVLNDVGSFFNSLRDNLETLASLSPQQRSNLFQEPPTVINAPTSGKYFT
ncbi:jg15967 [Pararge aegeria aegeria]|uniref:Jg15967 protein n=1 Tax=Pararge aegeria aegeria TaxID=348720 RepID=A0A8S4R4J4_9NEOP|nr:jg15967 [Pararge aegeria aegeria]